ncbi:mycofactocin system glycosyltransferase [Actinomyces bovis]|uniref:Mycofactocin system glycosyltransferase n=1 Tax=Actinomyces bovis TaxID=1658 RepID=A0ABY1VMA2_9ACTO|nr:glycosyltransferase family 2 protein [Actinomyces bovis]SPT53135.1 mycofactocin system glycosyltransferase [Actinomyces bovis]VEG52292.1 mycofactocin system glycosyltransferase [Actinomyces israelii]
MQPIRLTIAMLTYRRNTYLTEVLPLLVREAASVRAAGEGHPAVEARVLIIDNDPEGGAADTVAQAASQAQEADTPVDVVYVHEPEPGIVAARNRALKESEASDLLAFIDDDELPEPGWLAALLATRESTGADAVTGPTPPRYERKPDAWVAASGIFDSWDHPDGQVVGSADTGNLLLDLHTVRRLGLAFDPRYGLSGGEDSLFTRQLTLGGGKLCFAAKAVVTKRVPPSRANRSWSLQRAFRAGSSWSRVRVDTKTGARLPLRLKFAVKGLAKAGVGGTLAGLSLLRRDLPARARHEVNGAGGLGMVLGAFGADVREYSRKKSKPHGH